MATSPYSGSLRLELRDGQPWLIGLGQIDVNVVEQVSEFDVAAMRTAGEVAVDMQAVTFLDSTALGLLIRLRGGATSLRFRRASEPVRRMLSRTGLDAAFVVDD